MHHRAALHYQLPLAQKHRRKPCQAHAVEIAREPIPVLLYRTFFQVVCTTSISHKMCYETTKWNLMLQNLAMCILGKQPVYMSVLGQWDYLLARSLQLSPFLRLWDIYNLHRCFVKTSLVYFSSFSSYWYAQKWSVSYVHRQIKCIANCIYAVIKL